MWSAGEASTAITFRLGLANSIASLVIVALGPVLGAIADRGSRRKRFLMAFMVLGVTTTGVLTWVAMGRWQLALALFVLATVGFLGANVFYDSLIVSITSEDRYDVVSALGYGLGYLGGGVLFAGCVALTVWPARFGLAGPEQAVRLSFLLTALWWAVFSIPLFLVVREAGAAIRGGLGSAVRGGLSQLATTFHEIRRLKTVALFLLAYWLYIDGVDTIIRMAVDYGMALGFGRNGLILALLITQFVGFPAAIAFGRIGTRLGAKTGILIGIGVYVAVTVWAFFMDSTWEFYALAVTIGLVQGGVQALSRFVLRTPHPTREVIRVLRLLQHAGQVRGGDRAGADGLGGRGHRQPAPRHPFDRGAVPGRRHAAPVRQASILIPGLEIPLNDGGSAIPRCGFRARQSGQREPAGVSGGSPLVRRTTSGA